MNSRTPSPATEAQLPAGDRDPGHPRPRRYYLPRCLGGKNVETYYR